MKQQEYGNTIEFKQEDWILFFYLDTRSFMVIFF